MIKVLLGERGFMRVLFAFLLRSCMLLLLFFVSNALFEY